MKEIIFRSDVTVELIKSDASDFDVVAAARVSTQAERSVSEVAGP
jgi:thymidylate synthase (FAD)